MPPCLRGGFFGCGVRRVLCGVLLALLFAFPSHAADTKVSDVAHAAELIYQLPKNVCRLRPHGQVLLRQDLVYRRTVKIAAI